MALAHDRYHAPQCIVVSTSSEAVDDLNGGFQHKIEVPRDGLQSKTECDHALTGG